jgi:ribonuclease HI
MSNELFPEKKRLIIYTDGGARGNPGPAAIGVVVGNKTYGEKIGKTTNNVAEYQAVIFALKKSKALLGKKKAAETELEINLDSDLLAKQLNGEYKIHDKDLQPLFMEVWNLRLDFKNVKFRHIPREQNKAADRLVNRALDAAATGEQMLL